MLVRSLAVLAASWGILMALSPLLQVRKVVQRSSSADVSIPAYLVLLVGFGLWLAYGLAASLPAIVIPNLVAVVVTVFALVVVRRYREPRSAAESGGPSGRPPGHLMSPGDKR